MVDMVLVEMERKYFKELLEDNTDLMTKLTYCKDSKGNILKVIVAD